MRMSDTVIAETRAWVDRVVIGLNLCPFAKASQVKGRVRYVVSEATDPEALRPWRRPSCLVRSTSCE